MGRDGRNIHKPRRKDVSGTLETVRKLVTEMGGKGCKYSLKKAVMKKITCK